MRKLLFEIYLMFAKLKFKIHFPLEADRVVIQVHEALGSKVHWYCYIVDVIKITLSHTAHYAAMKVVH